MRKRLTVVLFTAGAALLIAAGLSVPRLRAHEGDTKTFTVDVAIDGSSNRPLSTSTSFNRGDTFIVDGTVYPAGTLPTGMANNDPNAPGGIGKIICRGTYVISSTEAANGVLPPANVTELYLLPDDATELIADGHIPNVEQSIDRTVLGGTGRFAGSVGEVHEQSLGMNATGFCNLRVTFKLKRSDE